MNNGEIQDPSGGRPTIYSHELEERICELLASGKSIREICKERGMPSRDTVNAWKSKNQAFSARYSQAVEDRGELLSSQIVDIADDLTGDPVRDRLRVDARKWVASKLFPYKYGDKVTNDVNLKGSIIIQASPMDEKL